MSIIQKNNKIFYGWWIVGACFLISAYAGGAVYFGFTTIFEPLVKEFGWSYTEISLAPSMRGLVMAILIPFVGLLVDRWGPRRLVFGGAVTAGSGLILLSCVHSLTMFYGAFILIYLGMSTCTGPVMMTAVANWFRRKMSMATGIMLSGVACGGLLIPLLTSVIDKFGWQMAMVILGLGMWIIVLPLSLLIRHKPEQYGYLPDGDANTVVVADDNPASGQNTDVDIEARQAVTSRTFWHLALAFMCGAMVLHAVITHIMPYMSSIGIARSVASLVAGAVPLASIIGRLGFGWLGGKPNKKQVTAFSFVLNSLGLLFFACISLGSVWLLIPFIILFSSGWGGNASMSPVLVRNYFGKKKLGTMLGITFSIMMLGEMAGPLLAGWVFDEWGSYQGIWFAFAALSIAAIVIVLTTPAVIKSVRAR